MSLFDQLVVELGYDQKDPKSRQKARAAQDAIRLKEKEELSRRAFSPIGPRN